MSEINVGIIGAGGMGREHARALASIEGVGIAAVADPVEERRNELAAKHSAKAFASHKELLDAGVDAVWICTPPYQHKDQTVDALKAGKHVMLEKPMALSLADADAVLEAARSSPGKLTVGYVLNFFPAHQAFVKAMQAGELGELVSCWVHRMGYAKFPDDHWMWDPKKSGGMLIECMCHEVDWLVHVGGSIKRVFARIDCMGYGHGFDDQVMAMVEFAQGSGSLRASWASKVDLYGRGVIGTKAAMTTSADGVTVCREAGKPEKVELPTGITGVDAEDIDFIEAIRSGGQPRNDPSVARHVLAACLAMHQSSKIGEVIEVE